MQSGSVYGTTCSAAVPVATSYACGNMRTDALGDGGVGAWLSVHRHYIIKRVKNGLSGWKSKYALGYVNDVPLA